MTRRLFINELLTENGTSSITNKDDNHYLQNVLRCTSGDKLEIIDIESGKIFQCTITDIQKQETTLNIESSSNIKINKPVKITIIQGIPKSQKMETIIQKCTEIGADTFIPMNMTRCVSDIKGKSDKKIQRWQKIAKEAAKQSRRYDIPTVNKLTNIKELKNIYKKNDLNLVLWEETKDFTLKSALKNKQISTISITIGPEGGITSKEINELISYGATPVSIGENILRTETAPIAACAMINYEYML